VPGEDSHELELKDYLRTLRRRRMTILVTFVLTIAAAVGYSLIQTPIYEATAKVLVKPAVSQQIFDPSNQNQNQLTAQRNIDTELEVLRSRSVRDAARRELGHTPDVSVSGVGQTDVIAVTARSSNATRSARDARVYAQTYIDTRRSQDVGDLLAAASDIQRRINDVQNQLNALPLNSTERPTLQSQIDSYQRQLEQFQVGANLYQAGGLELVTKPGVPGSPAEPNTIRNALLAALLGLILGIGLAFLREYFDDSIKTKEDLERATGELAVLGMIPSTPDWKNRNDAYLVTVAKPESPEAEAYRTLRTALQFRAIEEPIRALQVTGASTAEGKTTTLANLAVTLAQTGQRVIVVDCDLRRPRVHEFFGLDNAVGFTTMLLGEHSLSEAIQAVPNQSNLAVLASGSAVPDPSELLALERSSELIDGLRDHCDLVLIDTPPIIPVSDPLIVSKNVDATLVVARAGLTTKRSMRRAVEMLRQVNAPLIGTILNKLGSKGSYGYDYGYGYSHGRYPTYRSRAYMTRPTAPPNGDRENSLQRPARPSRGG
jgi:polysaccharide biosynthesis transport protein